MRVLLSLLFGSLLAACDAATCNDESDIGGEWTINATPLGADAGTPALPAPFSIDAELVQQQNGPDFLGLSHWVYGTLTASAASIFPKLTIPPLMNNTNGMKTGTILGCALQINVPIATPVTDDNVDQGPLRISLTGNITSQGQMVSSDKTLSTVILVSDSTNTPRAFGWTATQK